MTQPNISAARAAGYSDAEIQDYLRQHYAQKAQGMSTPGLMGANLWSGLRSAGVGLGQMMLPDQLQQRTDSFSDDAVMQLRAEQDALAGEMTGGRLMQAAGETAPLMALPTGTLANAMTAIPKVGAALKSAGVGTRVLPTLTADSAAMGGIAGAVTPTRGDESSMQNALVGAVGGALIPGAAMAAGGVARKLPLPGSSALRERAVARGLLEDFGGQRLDQFVRQIAQAQRPSGLNTPTTAAITQDPTLAAQELTHRALPEFTAGWQQYDRAANQARWDLLDQGLGSSASVQAAKDATDQWKTAAITNFQRKVDPRILSQHALGFDSAVQGRLNAAVRNADPNAQEVYGHIVRAKEAGAEWTPQSLWNLRQTLKAWLGGTPPPGTQAARGAKIDPHIMEVSNAIDSMLNASSGNQWTPFLDDLGYQLNKEGQQKAGANIRNVFIDENTGIVRSPTGAAGTPSVTYAQLANATRTATNNKFGKGLGQTLDWPAEDAVTSVLGDLSKRRVIDEAKGTMTAGGGSMTAPFMTRIAATGGRSASEVINVMRHIAQYDKGRQAAVINEMLQNPEAAKRLFVMAKAQGSPLTATQKALIQAARAGALSQPLAADVE